MNALDRDKCFARRLKRAGNVDALGIVRVTKSMESARQKSNDEHRSSWGVRYFGSGQHRRRVGDTYQR